MRLCNVEYSTYCTNNFKPTLSGHQFFFHLKLGICSKNWGKDNFWHWEFNRITAIKLAKNKPYIGMENKAQVTNTGKYFK